MASVKGKLFEYFVCKLLLACGLNKLQKMVFWFSMVSREL